MILTAFTAASAASYLQTVDLDAFPKYNCIHSMDLLNLLHYFFNGREPATREDDVICFKSKLFYNLPGKPQRFKDKTTVHCEAYNNAIQKDGCSTLMAFYNTQRNMTQLAQKMQPHLNQSLTFFSLVKQATPLTQQYISLRSAL